MSRTRVLNGNARTRAVVEERLCGLYEIALVK